MIEENPSKNRQEDADTNSESIAPPPAPSAEIPPPPPIVLAQQTGSQPAANSGTHEPEATAETSEKELGKFERKILHATWAAVAAAFITGVFIYGQFRTMSDQSQILSAQAISAVAGAIEVERNTREQLRIANDQAKAAQGQVNAITKQMRQDQRAWIKADGGTANTMHVFINEPISTTMALVNVGKSPAIKVVGDFVIQRVKNGSKLTFPYEVPHTNMTVGALWPNAPTEVPVASVTMNANKKGVGPLALKKEEYEDLRQGNSFLIIYARVQYWDIFGTPHWTQYCSFVPAARTTIDYYSRSCTDYNSVDSN